MSEAEIKEVIESVISEIWNKYDKDKSGELDKDEARDFVKAELQELGEGCIFNEQEFDALFKESFDEDGDARIQRDEMRKFLL